MTAEMSWIFEFSAIDGIDKKMVPCSDDEVLEKDVAQKGQLKKGGEKHNVECA